MRCAGIPLFGYGGKEPPAYPSFEQEEATSQPRTAEHKSLPAEPLSGWSKVGLCNANHAAEYPSLLARFANFS